MTEINVALLFISAGISLTGFTGGKKYRSDSGPVSLPRRVTLLGWTFLVLLVLGLVLGLLKEVRSFEGRTRAVYPRFYSLVEEVTGYSEDQWTRYFSYRMSLRLLLQKAHNRLVGGDLPPSMERTLEALGRAGAVDDALCRRLDYLRWHTYTTEWAGLGKRPDPEVEAKLKESAASTLQELDARIGTVDREKLRPNTATVCGRRPD